MRNRAATDIYEPGSVFKIVPVSASLNEHLVTPWTKFDCGASSVEYKGRTIRLPGEHEAMGTMSVFEIVAQSSNRGAARMGMLLGEERLYKYARLFGFGEETGLRASARCPACCTRWRTGTG
jgi:cell division protein FtsI/penicillin-binding protein 2